MNGVVMSRYDRKQVGGIETTHVFKRYKVGNRRSGKSFKSCRDNETFGFKLVSSVETIGFIE